MNSNAKILLVGTGSLLNYGCEAIVQGTYAMLSEHWPEATLTVASDDLDYDRKLFEGCEGIEFVSYRKRFTVYRLLMGILRRFGIGNGSPVRMNTRKIKDYDIFLSAGGDNYAEAPDGTIYHILQDLMKMGEKAYRLNKMFAIWGASVGPFSTKNLKRVLKNIKKATLILPREKLSYDYLKKFELGSSKVKLVADPAFYMEADSTATLPLNASDRKVIGLNFSRLSIAHSFSNTVEATSKLFEAFDYILERNPAYYYLCIPHVIIGFEGAQDDYSFMEEYKGCSPFADRIHILDRGIGATKTKGYILKCDLLIAARMHCCIAGISAATPTVFLTYSQKGIGMARYAYGNDDLTINLKDFTADSLDAVIQKGLNNRRLFNDLLLSKSQQFLSDAASAVHELKNVFYNRTGS